MTQPAPGLTSNPSTAGLLNVSSPPKFADDLAEFAGRLCYASLDRMHAAPNFVRDRMRAGHEDIIEHVQISILTNDPVAKILHRYSPYIQISEYNNNQWLCTANARVWEQLILKGAIGSTAATIIRSAAPAIFGEPTGQPPIVDQDIADTEALQPFVRSPMKVTLISYSQPTWPIAAMALQHGSATFLLEGVSRSLTHQLVRHRRGSYSQESQRYVDLAKGKWKPIIPESIANNPAAEEVMSQTWDTIETAYQTLRSLGIKKEDARFLLPSATETKILATMSYADWRHFINQRAIDKAAQWEIRQAGQAILDRLYAIQPAAFWDQHATYTNMQKNAK